ncbi:MAG: thiamine pyrophosphate-dependent dehydrogenase E1 component subunit alpha, partial [Myxococcales bacterium]
MSRTPTDDIDRPTRLALYRSLVEIRVLEKRAYDLFLQNLVKGTSHLSLGQEAVAAGFAVAMRKDDYTFCTYRGHAHTLARGAPMVGVLGELMGRKCGLMGGKGGSMHLTSVSHGAMGSYAIVGAHLPVAAGAAWSAQVRGTDQVAVCFFGDGTTNIGAFHEALNFAAVWKLPVVFVCENNEFGMGVRVSEASATATMCEKAANYNMPVRQVDGMDVLATRQLMLEAAAHARSGRGPFFIEAMCYRFRGHSAA